MKDMFCFQCEQTAGSVGCMGKAGVCGKQASTANLQDDLTGAMIGLAQVAELSKPTDSTTKVMLEGLFTTITNVNFDDEVLQKRIADVHREKALLGATVDFPDYKMWDLWDANEDVRSLKSLILLGLRGVAAYAYHAWMLGYKDEEVNAFFYKGMAALANKDKAEDLLPLVMETGRINFKCMEMLDKANTESYGTPVPTTVPLMVEKGPFIVVTGHDLKDLHTLLEQTKDKGINIYTHGEMLPCHAYPKLKAYPQLKGNFGTVFKRILHVLQIGTNFQLICDPRFRPICHVIPPS